LTYPQIKTLRRKFSHKKGFQNRVEATVVLAIPLKCSSKVKSNSTLTTTGLSEVCDRTEFSVDGSAPKPAVV